MALQLDHLVVAAATLDDGVAWCEATLGITPGPGGRHALMGTHNRVFALDGAVFPRAYFEIIAIDRDAPAPGRARWFGLDDADLQASIARQPRLVHWVARCLDIEQAASTWSALGLQAGRVLAASRPTPTGELRWRIGVRDDGRLSLGGALPTLIEWGEEHPTDRLPASGVELQSLQLQQPQPADLVGALSTLGAPAGVQCVDGPAAIVAVLNTPRGRVRLNSRVA
jgi:hypothetical protein